MKHRNIYLLAALLLITTSSRVFADENLTVDNSAQGGIEYDTNVYKTYNTPEQDWLTKILFITKGDYFVAPNFSLGWDYEGGGKVFFHDSPQNQLIQSLSVPLHMKLSPPLQIFFEPDVKYQSENDSLDTAGEDVNEDFISTKSTAKIMLTLPHKFYLLPQGIFSYFHFYPDNTFSYFREEMGLALERHIRNFNIGLGYDYLRQQFQSSTRTDSIQEITPYIQYLKYPVVSLSYTYQVNHSNDPVFSFTNHKISLLTSFLFGKYKNPKPDSPTAMFTFHFIGTLQLKNYSSVTAETPEGERFLVTNSEEDNFNNLVVKLDYHFTQRWSLDAKYSRISNDLTNQFTKFSRSLYYGGLRFDF